MSLVHSSIVLQALSSYTGTNVKHWTNEATSDTQLNVYNFISTTFVKNHAECSFRPLFVDIDEFLDPDFHYDFRGLKDDSTCKRGNEPYKRPCGWMRIAIKVLDKYPDGNAWLGIDGWRSHSVDGEWPVSYHGTSMNSAKAIIESHFKPGSGQKYGKGIYSTCDIKEAAAYSDRVTCEETGKQYQVLLQNRINPKKRKICEREDYWLIEIPDGTPPDKEKKIVEESIRPYGILFKEVESAPDCVLC